MRDHGIDGAASGYGGIACDIGFNFTFNEFWTDPKTGITAGVDSLGQLDPGNFGTTVDGSISESPLPAWRRVSGQYAVSSVFSGRSPMMRLSVFSRRRI